MGHFAKIVDGKVTQVIVAEKEFFDTFIDSSPGQWLRTSYNMRGGIHYLPNSNDPNPDQSMALRKNYAGVGYTYDPVRDAFIAPSPFPSWVLDEQTCLWNAPIPMPADGKLYTWNEAAQTWDAVATPTPVETLP
jgi:hypothetical protein